MEDNKELLQKIFDWGDGYGYILLNSEMCELIDMFKPYIEQVEKEAYHKGYGDGINLESISKIVEEREKEARKEERRDILNSIENEVEEAEDSCRYDMRDGNTNESISPYLQGFKDLISRLEKESE